MLLFSFFLFFFTWFQLRLKVIFVRWSMQIVSIPIVRLNRRVNLVEKVKVEIRGCPQSLLRSAKSVKERWDGFLQIHWEKPLRYLRFLACFADKYFSHTTSLYCSSVIQFRNIGIASSVYCTRWNNEKVKVGGGGGGRAHQGLGLEIFCNSGGVLLSLQQNRIWRNQINWLSSNITHSPDTNTTTTKYQISSN